MKQIILLTYIFLFTNNVFSQDKKNTYAIYNIYKYKNGIELNSTGILEVNNVKNQSLFTLSQYKNLIKKDDNILNQEENTLFLNDRKVCFDDYYYQNNYKNKKSTYILYDYSCDTKKIISQKMIKPKWIITKFNEKILGYTVNKATAKINDRIWNVYYSNKIKTKFNPWRFIGLKGLVIYAEDNSKTYIFKINKFINKQNPSILDISNNKLPKSNFDNFKSNSINQYWKNIEKSITNNGLKFNKNDLSKYETLEFIEN